ncbi:sigma-B regulation protein RsbU (phosphoserine phosphatase) [Lentzea atacamensis]|uniref:Sigma-B regulation protein RsbU (Phosphoserine phosphatase) n=2 Tax=Lentzea TaxID=165301 RepID=A0A316I4E7_9PSEU|nr:SpoIIE family protein phosphatase [Lentzea atacamensis]PWK87287.1 sigma-B regulation protein RsbU (phosphoserine phosphatase) [Lentzea atacamensis]RAS70011.1 sigma-B regulation protein RsbU (phosphoserine phosphatase) [Lentzea atacamensis]
MTWDSGTFAALLEDSAEDLYDNAPCGYVSTLLDGTIAKINATLLAWLGYDRDELVGRRRFPELLTVGGRMYYETHFAPLLQMQGEIGGVALEVRTADGTRLPVLLTSTVKNGPGGEAQLIRTTVFDARDRRAYEEELLRARQQAERERDKAQQLARTLQQTLLPPALPVIPGVQVEARYHPASLDQVGGDFYDVFPLGGDTWGFFLGDVSGKGVDAAVVTSLTRYTLRAAAINNPDPVSVLKNLNTVLNHAKSRLCTVIYGCIRPAGDGATVTLATGGHTPPLLLRADGTAELVELPGGQLVGVLPDARVVTTELRLTPGDVLLCYTDGLTEARVDGAVRYSEEELRDDLAGLAPATAVSVIAAAGRLLAGFGDGVEDDTALLAFGVEPLGAISPVS